MSSKSSTPAVVLSADDATAAPLVAVIKAAVNGIGKYAAYVAAHNVTRETVKDHAYALAVLTYPNEKPVQTANGARTKFGNAVQKAGAGLRYVLDKEDKADAAPVMRVTLSGEGGGSIVIDAEDNAALYETLAKMIAAK